MIMADAPWTRRLARAALWLGLAALAVAGIGLTLARFDVIAKMGGLYAMVGGLALAAIATLTGLIALVMNMRFRAGVGVAALIGLIIGGGYTGFMLSRMAVARSVPPIHDVTTDLTNPPRFTRLALRPDNLVGVETEERWRALHSAAYADIQPVIIAKPMAAVIADADRLARARGWTLAISDPQAGTMEATANVSYIRFQDDVALRVTPAPGGGSKVDMRSVSRIGVSDLGINAARIREFLAALQAA
jgi:uncharacterized protein (DUF1499 family)